ncbi:GATA transcription factor 27 isoform X1 [Brassica rapa]|uniref:GATA transcription factor 27 isoform X1 n=1 Tax=Brassica campestris TaxID=3711 RepID=UPI00142E6109|nr:GATA transcription factor 27 isoform X1 [Brassica rapa]
MGKQGPCYHCGVTSTPLWRNGPPEKPVLCNACGSRWRTKGSLVNYTPLHARAEGDEVEIEDRRGGQKMMMINGMSMNRKRKPYQESFTVKRTSLEFSNGFKKRALEEEASNNRSSSGSVVSNSESCDQSNAWETSFAACKKRTCVGRPKAAASSSVEKLTKDLFSILQEQQSSCCVSGTSEEELLFENESPMVIGHGSVLLRDPREDSEASSLLVESSKSSSIHSHNFGGKAIKQEQLKRTKSQVLGRHSLPLCNIDLKYVFNFDEFKEKFTKEEQQTLMKLLPQVDLPDSLLSMFESSQFKENFSLFQQLVADGVFGTSTSSSGSKLEEFKTLAKLALSDPDKSHLLESYQMLKVNDKEIEDSVTTTSRVSNPNTSDNNSLVTIKKPCESLNHNFSETRVVMKSPKEVMKIGSKHIETKEIIENSVSSLNHMSYGGSMVCGGYEDNDNSDQDLLLDVPSNGSFPQAELLHMI